MKVLIYLILFFAGKNAFSDPDYSSGTQGDYIYFRGFIDQKSSNDLINLLNRNPKKKLIIQSPGGMVEEAIKISKTMQKLKSALIVRGLCASSCSNYLIPSATMAYIEMGSIILFHGDLQTSLITLNKSPSTKVDMSKDLSKVIEMEKNFNSENEKSYALHLMQKIRRAEQDKKFEVKYKNKVHHCTGLNEYIWIPAPEVLIKYSIFSKIIPPIENIATHINTGKPSSPEFHYDHRDPFATCKVLK